MRGHPDRWLQISPLNLFSQGLGLTDSRCLLLRGSQWQELRPAVRRDVNPNSATSQLVPRQGPWLL